MMANAKVTGIKIGYIEDYYQAFLGQFGVNTAKNYRCDINYFFNKVYCKEHQFVTVDDILGTTAHDITKYSNFLSELVLDEKTGESKPRYKINTANRRIKSVKSFFTHLAKTFKDIDLDMFDNTKSKKPIDAESWDGLDWHEAKAIWEYAGENSGSDSNELSMLFKLASITSIRIDSLLNSTWEKNWFVKNERGADINYIRVIDKGVPHIKSISDALFNELQDKLGNTGRLFPTLYVDKVREHLQTILDALGFDKRRNIKVHSFKKAGVMRALEMTGNMYKAQKQGNHTSMATTEKYYLKYKECLSDMTSYTMDSEINIEDELKDLNKEELVEAFSKMSDSSKFELLRLLKK